MRTLYKKNCTFLCCCCWCYWPHISLQFSLSPAWPWLKKCVWNLLIAVLCCCRMLHLKQWSPRLLQPFLLWRYLVLHEELHQTMPAVENDWAYWNTKTEHCVVMFIWLVWVWCNLLLLSLLHSIARTLGVIIFCMCDGLATWPVVVYCYWACWTCLQTAFTCQGHGIRIFLIWFLN